MENGSQEGAGGTGLTQVVVSGKYNIAAFMYDTFVSNIEMTLDPRKLPPVAIRRILDVYRTGILTPGVGDQLLSRVLGDEFPYVSLQTQALKIPDKNLNMHYARRPATMYLNHLPKTIKKKLKEFEIQERARWKILTGEEFRRTYYHNDDYIALSGLMTLPQLRKAVMPIIMTPARKELGEELAQKFLSTEKYILTYKDSK